MRVVLDTNILLIAIPTKSKFRPIFDCLLKGHFELAISNDILSEYVEIIQKKTNAIVSTNITELLNSLQNVLHIDVFFKWNLITADPDDNKFVDCAIASNAQYIVTNDNHFKELKSVGFPRLEVISAENFLAELNRYQDS